MIPVRITSSDRGLLRTRAKNAKKKNQNIINVPVTKTIRNNARDVLPDVLVLNARAILNEKEELEEQKKKEEPKQS